MGVYRGPPTRGHPHRRPGAIGVSHAQREIPCLPNSSNENQKGARRPVPWSRRAGGQAPRASQPRSQTGGVVDSRRHNDAMRRMPYDGERHRGGPSRGPRDPNQGSCSPRKGKGPIGTPGKEKTRPRSADYRFFSQKRGLQPHLTTRPLHSQARALRRPARCAACPLQRAHHHPRLPP